MRSREKTGTCGVGGGNGQRFEGLLREVHVEMAGEVRRVGKLANSEFRGDLPRGSRADQDGIGARSDKLASGRRKRGIIREPPQQGVSVQKKAQKSLPGLEFCFRERLEEFAADGQFPFQAAGLALASFGAQGFEANKGLVATGDDDFLALASFFNEAGKMRFGVMDFDGRHIS